MSTLEAYKAAMNDLEEATEAFQQVDEFIGKLTRLNKQSSMPLLLSFGLKPPQLETDQGCDRGATLVKEWPLPDEVESRARRLTRAFNATHDIYAKLSDAERKCAKEPPLRPRIRWYASIAD